MCFVVISPFPSHQSLGESRDWLIFLFVYYFNSQKRNFSIREILYSEGSIPKVLDIYTEEDDVSNESSTLINIGLHYDADFQAAQEKRWKRRSPYKKDGV